MGGNSDRVSLVRAKKGKDAHASTRRGEEREEGVFANLTSAKDDNVDSNNDGLAIAK